MICRIDQLEHLTSLRCFHIAAAKLFNIKQLQSAKINRFSVALRTRFVISRSAVSNPLVGCNLIDN